MLVLVPAVAKAEATKCAVGAGNWPFVPSEEALALRRPVARAAERMVSDPQPEDDDYGHLVEEEVRQIVAQLGVADFVYTLPVVRQGTGTREVGDALLFSNGMGAILQMKSRLPGSREDDGSAWLTRRGGKAYRQGKGSRRKIALRQAEGTTDIAFPVRAADWAEENREAAGLPLTMNVSQWPVIVVLDHPNVDGIDPPFADAFWITASDWLELNRALRSVTAVLTYVQRVLDAEDLTVPLGHEADRFRAVVEADARYADEGGPMSRPWLTADSLRDATGADLYRELLVRLWPPEAVRPHVPIADLRRVLEFLDGVPPGMQVTVGRWILKKRGELRTQPRSSGAVMWSGDRLLIFGCARDEEYGDIEQFDADLAAVACVRSREVREQGGRITAALAVGHLVADEYIDYRYIYMEPPVDAPNDLKRIILHTYGRFDLAAGRAAPITAGRNDPCPCGSGRKFKVCDRA